MATCLLLACSSLPLSTTITAPPPRPTVAWITVPLISLPLLLPPTSTKASSLIFRKHSSAYVCHAAALKPPMAPHFLKGKAYPLIRKSPDLLHIGTQRDHSIPFYTHHWNPKETTSYSPRAPLAFLPHTLLTLSPLP